MDSEIVHPISCVRTTIFSVIMVSLFLFRFFSYVKGSSFYGNF